MSARHVAIVGSGIVGTTFADLLTARGHRVTLLEKGPDCPYPHQPQYAERVLYGWQNPARQLGPDLRRVISGGGYARDLGGELIQTVGGMATVWGAMTDRLHPHDFAVRSRYGFGADWPLGYDDLEPWYCKAEERLGVSGEPDAQFGAPRSRPYPLPPFEHSYDIRLLGERLASAGLALTTSPQARTRAAFDRRPACVNTGACDTCPIGARYSPNHHLQRALAGGRLTLQANTSVRRIVVEGGRARAVVWRPNDGGRDSELAADAIVVAAGAIESARLLLLSGHAGEQVGRNLLFHNFWGGHLDYDEELFAGRVGPEMGQSRQFIDPPTRGKHGGLLWQLPSVAGIDWHLDPAEKAAWRSGADVMRDLAGLTRCEAIGLHAESAPSPDKYLTLADETDRFGDRFARVRYRLSDFDHATWEFARRVLAQVAAATRARSTGVATAGEVMSGFHHLGTCRMSARPADGVTDSFGRVHGVARLWVGGGALFPGSGAVHPTLTMVALALRAADRLLGELDAQR